MAVLSTIQRPGELQDYYHRKVLEGKAKKRDQAPKKFYMYLCCMKKTLVIGASENPERYAYKATHKLLENGHEVVLLGLKEGLVAGVKIHTKAPVLNDIDTVTLYVGPKNQGPYLEYVCNLNPKRVIFNPGTENPEFQQQLTQKGIAFEESCTLVLLANGLY